MKSTYEVVCPCVFIFLIEEDGYCIGCGRTGDEIMEWLYADNDRKLEILERIANG